MEALLETSLEVEPVEVDGYLINPETGEVVGHVDGAFRVDDTGSAEWVLEKMLVEDTELEALIIRMDIIEANLHSMKMDRQRRRAWLEMRFGSELIEFARENLPKKAKTWKCPFGKVSFRTVGDKVKVNDEERAVNFLRDIEPEAIKTTEKVMVSRLSDKTKAKVAAGELKPWGFEYVPGGESVTIKTGI